MIPSDASFDGKNYYEYNGRTYYRWYYLKRKGDYDLKFKIVSTNSKYLQGISLNFANFKGKILLNGQNLPVPKGVFQHYIFRENEFPKNEFCLSVRVDDGDIFLANASQRDSGDNFSFGAFSYAFWIETLSNGIYRFHCNDFEYDNDFDDLIFDLEIIPATL